MGVVTLADALPYRVDDLTGVPIDVLGVGVDDPGGGIAALAGRGDSLAAHDCGAQVLGAGRDESASTDLFRRGNVGLG